MFSKLIGFIKPALGALAVLLVLQMTGLLTDVSAVAQSTVMKTGLMDASLNSVASSEEAFDYQFVIKDLQGTKVQFEQFKGKVVFLNLWATWCGPCSAEMPTIQKLYDEVKNDSVVFVMLSLDKDQDKQKIVNYIASKEYTFPIYQPSGYLSSQLSVPSIPTTFVISKDGKIVAKEVGTTNFHTAKFKKFINELVAK